MLTHCQDHILYNIENIWFVWSKTSYSDGKWEGKKGLLSQWMLDALDNNKKRVN